MAGLKMIFAFQMGICFKISFSSFSPHDVYHNYYLNNNYLTNVYHF